MSSPPFSCVFCNDKFESKDSLAQHFRTHATGMLPGSKFVKPVNRNPTSKTTIKCDVCTEEFNTTTDAISHKYKKHRDAPIKHFCAWCGKQFPIKHIWELHQQTHAHEVKPFTNMSCNVCDAEFYNEKACTYHQKSFHRAAFSLEAVDIPPPSKKISINSHGDVLSMSYCPFCGVEYIIKYNLQKHIHDHHSKQSPPIDVVKCTICDAHFYDQKAYNFHTTYHKTDDLYVTSEEMRQQIVTKIDLDFDFRRIKTYTRAPTKKKMKSLMDKMEKNFFQIGDMSTFSPSPSDDESEEDIHEAEKPISSKRKHEKVSSNPETITLDQFVNMNKEIFSDCFDTATEPDDAQEINPMCDENQDDIKLEQNLETIIPANITNPNISAMLLNAEVNAKKVKKEIMVKKITVPVGSAPPPGLKIITSDELKKMKQKGIVLSVVSKPPPVLNTLRKILINTDIKLNTSVDIIPVQDLININEIKAEMRPALPLDNAKQLEDKLLSSRTVKDSDSDTPEERITKTTLNGIQAVNKLQQNSEKIISDNITDTNISAMLSNSEVSTKKVKEILVKKITVPAGAVPPNGMKIITSDELKKMKQKGIHLSVVSKSPPVLNTSKKTLIKTDAKPKKSVDIIPVQDLIKTNDIKVDVQPVLPVTIAKEVGEKSVTVGRASNDTSFDEVLSELPSSSIDRVKISPDEMDEKLIKIKCLDNKAIVVLERDPRIHSSMLQLTLSVNPNSLACKKPSPLKKCKEIKRRINSPRSAKNVKHYNTLSNVSAH